jgi:hypothetical protein
MRSYTSFSRLATAISGGVAIGALVLFGIDAWPEPEALASAFTEAVGVFAFGSPTLSCFLCLVSILFPYRVDREGLIGYTIWGWPIRAHWDDIAEVSHIHSQGIPYLAIRRHSARSLVLVCDELHKQQEFDNAVASFVKDDHPLRDWILPEEPTSSGASASA